MQQDQFVRQVVQDGDDPEIRAVLQDVCRITGMGFAAVARVTEDRWIACQVLDQIEFGLEPGGELAIGTTICNDIRASGQRVVIDHVQEDRDWCTHPTPILYGFKSYVSLPLVLADGSFYGTLCAIDPEPRLLKDTAKLAQLDRCAERVVRLLARAPAGRGVGLSGGDR